MFGTVVAAMLDHGAAKRNCPTAAKRAKSGKKREGADSQNVVHFSGSAWHSPAFARSFCAPAGAAHRDSKAC